MRKIKFIPSRSGLQFRPFNVNVIIFVLFCVSLFSFLSDLHYTHVLQIRSNNQTFLECKPDALYISTQNQTRKCKYQQSNLPESVKTVEPCEWFVGPPGSVVTPFCLNAK